MEIVGSTLVLIVSHYNPMTTPEDHMYVYDWKQGLLKAVRPTPHPFFFTLNLTNLNSTHPLQTWPG